MMLFYQALLIKYIAQIIIERLAFGYGYPAGRVHKQPQRHAAFPALIRDLYQLYAVFF